jgi:hypothetical protein
MLLRVGLFVLPGAALWALLPLVASGLLARVSKDLEASAVFPQVQLFSIFSLAYYPRQRCGAYWARSKVV